MNNKLNAFELTNNVFEKSMEISAGLSKSLVMAVPLPESFIQIKYKPFYAIANISFDRSLNVGV